jgi:hypothetical protein
MTLRRPHQDAVLAAADTARIRRALSACSILLAWADINGGPELAEAAGDTAQAAGLSRAPGALAGELSLATGILDFAAAARSTR